MSGSILLVDDDPDILTVFQSILERNGYTTYTAMNFDDAIAAVKEHEIKLAILDFVIPGCRGDMMAKILKHINKNLEIIFLSGYDEVYEAVDKLDFPVYEIFMKPESTKEILSAIESIFNRDQRLTPSMPLQV
jgi:DNA-binding NtrC family response regulator